jgi:hypothetical protein
MFAGRRRFVLVALFALVASLLAVASPAVGGPLDNPFVGSWVSDDEPVGTDLRVQISNSGRFHMWDEEVTGGLCKGGLVTSSGRGSFDGDTFETPGTNRTCHPVDGEAFGLPDLPFTLDFVYSEASDTLELTIDEGCYYRRGADPSVCD